jgi:hypothetical protein
LAEGLRKALEALGEGVGHIAVDRTAAEAGHTAVVAGHRKAVVQVGRTAGAVGRSQLAAGVLVDRDSLNVCLVVVQKQEHGSQLGRVLMMISIWDGFTWKQCTWLLVLVVIQQLFHFLLEKIHTR